MTVPILGVLRVIRRSNTDENDLRQRGGKVTRNGPVDLDVSGAEASLVAPLSVCLVVKATSPVRADAFTVKVPLPSVTVDVPTELPLANSSMVAPANPPVTSNCREVAFVVLSCSIVLNRTRPAGQASWGRPTHIDRGQCLRGFPPCHH